MKRIAVMLLVWMSLFLLVSCAAGRYPYPDSDLSAEAWKGQMNSSPDQWVRKADGWFRAGGRTQTEYMNYTAPYSEAMSRTAVRVPNFHSIKINGDFHVQISGNPDSASLWFEGPNPAVRSIVVAVRNNVLCLDQVAKPAGNMKRVVVHISVTRLNSLVVTGGTATVEGVRLYSHNLMVDTNSAGHIFLAGQMNVKCVIVRNCGSVNIFTINTNQTEIESLGSGDVNITAQEVVRLRSVKHYGTGDINILNATSSRLMVDAYGKGKVNLRGCLDIGELRAGGDVCVFVDRSDSSSPCIYVYEDARVGIAGRAGTLYAYTSRTSRLMARSLHAHTIYAQSSGTSHMNISASTRAFLTARDYSSIYFYGDPDVMEPFARNNGTIIPMGGTPLYGYSSTRHKRRAQDTLNPPISMSADGNTRPPRSHQRVSRYQYQD